MLRLPADELDRELTAARNAGMVSIRIDVDWSRIERTPGKYDWSNTDRVVEAIRSHGLCPLGMIGYTPRWARAGSGGGSHHAPASPEQFAAFAAAAAGHYAGVIRFWEVWNEPNIDTFYQPRPDIRGYAALLRAAYKSIKDANPSAFVVSGGLAPAADDGVDISPITFVEGLYRLGANQYFDALAMHPYTYPALPNAPGTEEWNAARQMFRIRRIMVDGGDAGKSIWITEFGAPTGTSSRSVSPIKQAKSIRIVLNAAVDNPWIGPVFIYSIRDSGTDTANPEDCFGILHRDFTPKPAYSVIRTATGVGEGAPR